MGVKISKRLPVVLTKSEVQQILVRLSGDTKLIVQLLYGSGLRLNEAVRLRVKDIDFEQNQIIVRDGKGAQDRVSILPAINPRRASKRSVRYHRTEAHLS